MRPFRAALLLALLAAAPAAAQNETVTVTGKATDATREQIIQNFVQSYVAPPSRMIGKVARWHDPICPYAAGLKSEVDDFVSARVKEVAKQVGVATKDVDCHTNVIILFASKPQDVADEVTSHFNKYKWLIGDADTPSHARELFKITHPIQAWYGTGIEDAWGGRFPSEPCWPNPGDCMMISTGGNINNQIKSFFTGVFILVDTSKVQGTEAGAIADYVAMLALSQTRSYDTCLPLPTIANLMATGCDDRLRANRLTPTDLAYLRGLYKSDGGDNYNLARSDIETEMEKSPVALDYPK